MGDHLDGISNYFPGHKRVLHAGGSVGLAVADDDGIMQEGLASRSFNLSELVTREYGIASERICTSCLRICARMSNWWLQGNALLYLNNTSLNAQILLQRQGGSRCSDGDVGFAPVLVRPIATRAQIRPCARHLGPSIALWMADKHVALVFERGEGGCVNKGVDCWCTRRSAGEGGGGGRGGELGQLFGGRGRHLWQSGVSRCATTSHVPLR